MRPPSSPRHGAEGRTVPGKGDDGGHAKDEGALLLKGKKVWYRYTTRDGKHAVVFVPGVGWGFVKSSALDRRQTGTWSFPEKPDVKHRC